MGEDTGTGAADGGDEVRRLRSELAERDAELGQLRAAAAEDGRTIDHPRDDARQAAEELRDLRDGADEAHRIERAQAALIRELRAEVGDAVRQTAGIGEQLLAAERELVDLRAIRDALVSPTLVQRRGLTIAAEVIPAAPHVGGDFFYVGDGPNDTVVMAVGDVVGKGLAAARRSAFTRTALASVAPFSEDPGQLLKWVNVALVERIGGSAEFVTAACMNYDADSRLLRFAAAGHPPPLRLGSGGELLPQEAGVALGLDERLHCTSSSEQLEPGDGVVMFTDGVTEARGPEDRYGVERLTAALRETRPLSPGETLERLKQGVRDFAGGEVNDDVCLLVMRAED